MMNQLTTKVQVCGISGQFNGSELAVLLEADPIKFS